MTNTRTTVGVAIATAALAATTVTPAAAAYSGRVTKAECLNSRQGMSKGYLENTIYGAKGVVTARGTGWKTLSYLASKSWGSGSGVGVRYYFSSPEGRWRVWDVTCVYVNKLVA